MKTNLKKLPGSQRMRHRAKVLLKAHRVNDRLWIVSGGEASHSVKVDDGYYSCDCKHWEMRSTPCSHIIKVKMEKGIFPSRN